MAVPAAPYLIVPYASDVPGGQVLLARVNLANMRAQGGASPQIIPDHAGQWTLVDGDVPVMLGQPPLVGAFKLFKARTGLNLSDPAVLSRFGFSSPTLQPLQDAARAADFGAVYLQTNAPNLLAFANAINANLQVSSTTDGILVEVRAVAIADALSQIGAFAKPTSGWRGVIVDKVYGGRLPQAMDTTFPTLVNQIAARSQEPEDWYEIALKQLPGGDAPPVPQPRLVRLEVDNAQPVSGADDSYAATYDRSGTVTVRAVVEPSGAATGITWTWTDGTATGERCTIPLNRITPFGRPMPVTAALGRATLSIKLIIRPQLVGATVTGAEKESATDTQQVFVADYDETEKMQISIATEPPTSEAYAHLQWTGGEAGTAANVRLVSRAALTTDDNPIKVRVAINPWWDFILYVLPRIWSLEVVAGPGIYGTGGGNYEVDYQAPPATYTLRATTVPNIGAAHGVLSWTMGAVLGPAGAAVPAVLPPMGGPPVPLNEKNILRSPINNFVAPVQYNVEVRRRGVVRRSETVRVLVQPVLNGLAPAGCAIVVPGVANTWYSYNVGAPAGGGIWRPNVEPGPALRAVRAVPDTTPPISNALVAAHLRWGMTVGGAAVVPPAGPTQNMPLNAVTNYVATVRIGSDPAPARGRTLTLNVLQRENYAAGNPQLAVTSATFGAGSAVICDNTTMAYGLAFNAAFNGPHWVAGRAHNLQEPRTYAAGAVVQQAATINVPVPPLAPTNVNIRATAFVPRGDNATTRITWAGGAWNGVGAVAPMALGPINGAPALPAAEVAFADPLPMFWEMQIGAGPWILFDMTSQIVYVTLAAPIGYVARPLAGAAPPAVPAPVPYHTVLAISSRAAHGKTNNADVVERNYSVFRAINLANGDNANLDPPFPAPGGGPPRPDRLGYWKGHWVPGFNPNFTVPAMLQAGDGVGTCGAFADLFVAMGAVHGINTLHVVDIDPAVAPPAAGGAPLGRGILVKNWAFNVAPAVWPAPPVVPPPAAYTHYETPQAVPPAVPAPPAAGNAAWGPGLVGQNDLAPPSRFRDHAIVIDVSTAGPGTSGTLYDPSYGSAPLHTANNYVAGAIDGLYRIWNSAAPGAPLLPRVIVGYAGVPPVTVMDISAVAGGLITPAAVL